MKWDWLGQEGACLRCNKLIIHTQLMSWRVCKLPLGSLSKPSGLLWANFSCPARSCPSNTRHIYKPALAAVEPTPLALDCLADLSRWLKNPAKVCFQFSLHSLGVMSIDRMITLSTCVWEYLCVCVYVCVCIWLWTAKDIMDVYPPPAPARCGLAAYL